VTNNNTTPNRDLEAARLKKRWSVEVASKKVGVSVNTFNRWERGLQLPHLTTLDRLCNAFEMSSEDLGFANVIRAKRKKKAGEGEPSTNADTEQPVTGKQHPMLSVLQDSPSLAVQIRHGLIPTGDALQVVQGYDPGKVGEEITRRQVLASLISIPTRMLEITQKVKERILYADEILSFSAVNLPFCWQLYYEGGFSELRRIFPGYVFSLSALAQQVPACHQMWAANLASQAHQLSYLLALQRQDFGTALQHTQEAVRYGQQASDTNLQAASLARRAYIYFCLYRRQQKLQTYQEALRHCTASTPLLKGYIHAGLAEAYAMNGESDRAYAFLKLAQEHYPDRPEDDPVYAYTHFRWPTFYNFAGQVYLHVNKPKQAWEAFATVERLVPPEEEPYRLELMVYQAATALALGELEQSCVLLENAVKAARTLGSSLRYNEAALVFEHMQAQWGREPRVKRLQDLFDFSTL
jgi:transcriptional regulator with XRE-family HTH domain/tetratricopeptide (TPR) repeat protein